MTSRWNWPGVVFLIHAKPRTIPEVAELMGLKPQTVNRIIGRLEAEGLVAGVVAPREPKGGKRGMPKVWTWQDRP